MPQQQMTIDQAYKLGMQYHQAGQLAQAESIYRQILSVQPNHADAQHLLGLIAQQAGQFDASLELIGRAIAIDPNAVHYQANYAQTLAALGRREEAISVLRRVVSLQPFLAEAHYNLGNLLHAMDRSDEAITSFRQALRCRPDYVEALNNLGNCLRELGEATEAVSLLSRATQLQPALAEAHLNLGNALLDAGQFELAIASFQRTLQLRPDHPDALNGLGNALHAKGETQNAVEHFRRALAIDPRHASAMSNLARTFSDQGKPDQAIQVFRKALEHSPNDPAIHYNLGVALLEQGDLLEGFREYEYRWKARQLGLSLKWIDSPLWDGSDLNGREILLLSEQGFGDTIQFARYIPLVAQRGGKISLRCKPELAPVLKNIPGVERVVLSGQELPRFELHCPLMSLPRAFATTLETIPGAVPYLSVDSDRAAEWKRRLDTLGDGLKIGLVWAGHSIHANDRIRSAALEAFQVLGGVPSVQFVSLQKGPAAQQSAQPPEGMNLVDWTDDLHDFADTAALLQQLDLVIAVDTAVVHLAGALGKKAFVLLPLRSEWRWMHDREDSPWYPTLRLFKQRIAGDWNDPMMRIREELIALNAGGRHG